MSDTIHVAVRVRRLIKREEDQKNSYEWEVKNKNIVKQINRFGNPVDCSYVFDRVFNPCETNLEVYDELCKPIVKSVMKGFNGTIFAYGQTSSGKTFTMVGDQTDPGVIVLTIAEIFEYIENTPDREFLLRLSYMEIYNEQISDLLSKKLSSSLKITETVDGQILVTNLTEAMVNSMEEVVTVMNKGMAKRHIGETSMNEKSSRSHTIFRMIIESRPVGAGPSEAVMVSHLNLVDLAGSERTGQMGNTGDRLREGININLSLLTLGQVIRKLSEGESFVNFRDSKLTRILQNSLGGNTKTAIICTVTPASIEDTRSTLNFASRAKTIANKPIVNEILSESALLSLRQKKIRQLELEIEEMKRSNTHQLKVEEMERELKQRDKKIGLLEGQLKNLKAHVLVSSRTAEDAHEMQPLSRKHRRETWCAPVRQQRLLVSGACAFPLVTLHESEEEKLPTVQELPPNADVNDKQTPIQFETSFHTGDFRNCDEFLKELNRRQSEDCLIDSSFSNIDSKQLQEQAATISALQLQVQELNYKLRLREEPERNCNEKKLDDQTKIISALEQKVDELSLKLQSAFSDEDYKKLLKEYRELQEFTVHEKQILTESERNEMLEHTDRIERDHKAHIQHIESKWMARNNKLRQQLDKANRDLSEQNHISTQRSPHCDADIKAMQKELQESEKLISNLRETLDQLQQEKCLLNEEVMVLRTSKENNHRPENAVSATQTSFVIEDDDEKKTKSILVETCTESNDTLRVSCRLDAECQTDFVCHTLSQNLLGSNVENSHSILKMTRESINLLSHEEMETIKTVNEVVKEMVLKLCPDNSASFNEKQIESRDTSFQILSVPELGGMSKCSSSICPVENNILMTSGCIETAHPYDNVGSLNGELINLNESITVLQSLQTNANEELSKLKLENSELRLAHSNLETSNCELEKRILCLSGRENKIVNTLKRLESMVKCNSNKTDAKDHNEVLQVSNSGTDVSTLSEDSDFDLDFILNEISQLKCRVTEYDAQVTRLQSELETNRLLCQTMLEAKWRHANDIEARISELQEEKALLTTKVDQLLEDLALERKNSASQLLSEDGENHHSCISKHNQLMNEIELERQNLLEALFEKDAIQKQLRETNLKNDDVQMQYSKACAEMRALQEKIKCAELKIVSLEEDNKVLGIKHGSINPPFPHSSNNEIQQELQILINERESELESVGQSSEKILDRGQFWKRQLEVAKGEIKTLDQDIRLLQKQHVQSEGIIRETELVVNKLQQENKSLTAELELEKATLSDVVQEKEEQRQQLSDAQAVEHQLKTAENEIHHLKKQKELLALEGLKFQGEMQVKAQEIVELVQNLERKDKTLLEMKEKHQLVLKESVRIQADAKERIISLEEVLERNEYQIKLLEEQITDKVEENKEINIKLESSCEKLLQLRHDLQEKDKLLSDLQQESKSKVEAIETETAESQNKLAKMSMELKSATEVVSTLRAELNEKSLEMVKLRQEAFNASTLTETLRTTLQEREDEVAGFRKQLEELEQSRDNAVQKLETELWSKMQLIDTLRERIGMNQDELNELRTRYDAASVSMQQLRDEVFFKTGKMESLEKELDVSKLSLESRMQELYQKSNDVLGLEEKLSEASEQIQSLKDENEDKHQQMESNTLACWKEVKTLREENGDLLSKLQQAELQNEGQKDEVFKLQAALRTLKAHSSENKSVTPESWAAKSDDVEKPDQRCQELQTETEHQDKAFKEIRAKYDKLKEYYLDLKGEWRKQSVFVKDLVDLVEKKRGQNASVQTDPAFGEDTITALRKENTSLQQSLMHEKETKEKLKKNITFLRGELERQERASTDSLASKESTDNDCLGELDYGGSGYINRFQVCMMHSKVLRLEKDNRKLKEMYLALRESKENVPPVKQIKEEPDTGHSAASSAILTSAKESSNIPQSKQDEMPVKEADKNLEDISLRMPEWPRVKVFKTERTQRKTEEDNECKTQ